MTWDSSATTRVVSFTRRRGRAQTARRVRSSASASGCAATAAASGGSSVQRHAEMVRGSATAWDAVVAMELLVVTNSLQASTVKVSF